MNHSDHRNPDLRTVDLHKVPLQPNRWKYILAIILAQNNWRHATKSKGVSYETMEDRRQFLFRAFEFLRNHPSRPIKLDPRSFSGRHLEMLFEHYEARARKGKLSPSSLQKNHSILRTFATWIGKPDLVKPIDAYIRDPALHGRSYVARESKSWRANGIDVHQKVEEIAKYDERAASAVEMMEAFGLRFKEAVMFRPHVDVLTSAQAGKDESSISHYLRLARGTKGGLLRYVPVDTPLRQQAVARAQRVATEEKESLSDPRYTLVGAIRHLRYVMEKFGITKRELGVVPHGLRHQYVADEFRARTGVAPPVEGGPKLDKEVDLAARLEISEQVGHARTQITNAYLGSNATRPQPE